MGHGLEKIKDLFGKPNYVLPGQQKRYGILVFLCTLLSAELETLGLFAIMSIDEGLIGIDGFAEKWYLHPFANIFYIEDNGTLICIVCVGVVIIYFLKNACFKFYTWIVKKYTCKIKRELKISEMEFYMA